MGTIGNRVDILVTSEVVKQADIIRDVIVVRI
jgi:hypothetical protein